MGGTVALREVQGTGVIELGEEETGSLVAICPEVGANVFRFRTVVGARDVELLATPPEMATLRARPTRWGSACLFPYPGRVRAGAFVFQGQTYQLPTDPRDGHAIHGCVRTRPWAIERLEADRFAGAHARLHLDSRLAGITASEWPWPFGAWLDVALSGGRLRIGFTVANEGDLPMPFGLGFHPYFPLPFGEAGSLGACTVWIDADERWEQSGGLPTGAVVPLDETIWPRRSRSLADIPADVASGEGFVRNALFRRRTHGRDASPGGMRARIVDAANGVVVRMDASVGFDRTVFFTPAATPTLSIEPQTCVPNALAMAGEGRTDTGLRVLAPGARWQAWFAIEAEALAAR